MASTKTKVKPIRISNETADYFEGKPLNRMVESLSELLKSEKISFDGENLKVLGVYTEKNSEKSGASPKYPYGIKGEDIEELNSMAMFMGGTVGEMIRLFLEAVSDGTITYQDGRYVGTPDLEIENFEEACHDMGVDAQKILDKAAQGVRRGTL